MAHQEEMTKLVAENNALLRRNLSLFEVTQTLFPIDSEDKLKKLDNDLATEQRNEMVGAIKRIMDSSFRNIERILSKNIIMAFNYDGAKNKKALKDYENVLTALFDIQSLLQSVANQNKALLFENKMLSVENKKIYTNFTDEFIALKKSIDDALAVIKKPADVSLLPPLPFSTVSEVQNFEKDLRENEEMRIELISRYKNQPHNDLLKFVVKNLKLIFSDDLSASNFSWTNANGKLSVKHFSFIKILADVAVENISQTTYHNVEGAIKKYFAMTKDRVNKLNKRHGTANETNDANKTATRETSESKKIPANETHDDAN